MKNGWRKCNGSAVRRRTDPDAGGGRSEALARRSCASCLGAIFPSARSQSRTTTFTGGRDLMWSMEAGPEDLRATSRELPRLKGKSWWLTKQVQTFAVEEMRDLEFEPAVPILASELRTAEGSGPAHCLAQFGARALPDRAGRPAKHQPVGTPAGALDTGRMRESARQTTLPEWARPQGSGSKRGTHAW